MDRQIIERTSKEGNRLVIITQGGYDFVNIKGSTTVNIYGENEYLNDGDVIECYNMGDPNDSFKQYVKFWLKENVN